MVLRYATQVFLALAVIGFLAWVVSRFAGPIGGVSYEGFALLAQTSVTMAVGISLYQLAFEKK